MDTFESGLIKLGSNALEEILCKASTLGLWGARTPDATDPWSIEFPGLAALPRFDGDAMRLRICIATEDIVGPVRNGGIGTTYSALSELLAGLGHDVTILYLKGHARHNVYRFNRKLTERCFFRKHNCIGTIDDGIGHI